MAKYCLWRTDEGISRYEDHPPRHTRVRCYRQLRVARKALKAHRRRLGGFGTFFTLCRGGAYCGDVGRPVSRRAHQRK